MRTAAQLLAETLAAHGADHFFCVPGESFLALTDQLVDFPQMKMIVCRHEGGAGYMAINDAKVTGRPGVCFVSRGPGATNASIAIHTAKQDAIPAVFFIGQIERGDFGRNATQEVDYMKTFSDMAKLVIDVRDAKLVSEATARAFHVAQAGTPGPVVVVLPEDMLLDETDAPVCGPRPRPQAAPTAADLAEAARMLAAAKKPLVLIGGTYRGDGAAAAITRFAETFDVPVCNVFRRPDRFPNDHPHYGGLMGLRPPAAQGAAWREADLILAIGARMTDPMSGGYTFPRAPVPEQPLIHVYPDPVEIGRVWHPTLGIACTPLAFVEAMLAAAPQPALPRTEWIARLNRLDAEGKAYTHAPSNDGVSFGAVVHEITKHLKRDAFVSADAGNFSSFVQRYLRSYPEGGFFGNISGAMGGAVPAMVAAGLRAKPGQQLVAFVGDGGVLMTGNELATAMQYGVPIKIVISNNGNYGTIRFHQEMKFPGRQIATELTNPDFVKWGEAFGARGFRIENDADVAGVTAAFLAHEGPAVLDCRTSNFHMTAAKTFEEVHREGLARKAAREAERQA